MGTYSVLFIFATNWISLPPPPPIPFTFKISTSRVTFPHFEFKWKQWFIHTFSKFYRSCYFLRPKCFNHNHLVLEIKTCNKSCGHVESKVAMTSFVYTKLGGYLLHFSNLQPNHVETQVFNGSANLSSNSPG